MQLRYVNERPVGVGGEVVRVELGDLINYANVMNSTTPV